MTVTSIHPGVTREQIEANTGWPVRYAAERGRDAGADRPSELEVLRELHARTAARPRRSSALEDDIE